MIMTKTHKDKDKAKDKGKMNKIPMVVVGLVFKKVWKSELIGKALFGSYSSRRLLVSKWSNDIKQNQTNFHFLFLSKGQIQSSPPFPARLRLLVSSLLL